MVSVAEYFIFDLPHIPRYFQAHEVVGVGFVVEQVVEFLQMLLFTTNHVRRMRNSGRVRIARFERFVSYCNSKLTLRMLPSHY